MWPRRKLESADDQVNVAKAAVDNAQDLLNKTTIVAPLDGTITTLNSQLGERVLGTVQNAGTDIMIISDLSAMEARVDIGEMDVVLVQAGQKAKLEVDSFKDKKFAGVVTAGRQFVRRIEHQFRLQAAAARPRPASPRRSFRCASALPKGNHSAPACPSARRLKPARAPMPLPRPLPA